jgi:hypothetical protein
VNAGNINRVARLNYIIGGILVIAAAITQKRPVALGVTVGVILTCINFALLRRLVHRWTSDAAEGRSTTTSGMLLIPKMMGMMVAVVLCLWLLPISGPGFAVGYSVFVVSIFVEIFLSAFLPTPPSTEPNEQNHG